LGACQPAPDVLGLVLGFMDACLPVLRSTWQVSIKLKNTEPDQLASEIIAGISRVLNNQG
jgi:hypothetical protein